MKKSQSQKILTEDFDDLPFWTVRFYKGLLHYVTELIREFESSGNLEKFGAIAKNRIFNLPGEKHFRDPSTKQERIAAEIFQYFFEIHETYECLSDFDIYMRRFLFQKTRVNRIRYYKFHLGAYLQEIFILRERLLAYLKRIERIYKTSSRKAEIIKTTDGLQKFVKTSLEGYRLTRGAHVHKQRYNTPELQLLSNLATVKDSAPLQILRPLYRMNLREVRTTCIKTVQNSNKSVNRCLNYYFARLYPIIFDKSHRIILD